MPVRDDWDSLSELLMGVDRAFKDSPYDIAVTIVDDFSLDPSQLLLLQAKYQKIARIRVVRVVRNLGHQRAIAVGLVFLRKTGESAPVLVMDADGEDTPAGAYELVRYYFSQSGEHRAVFAARKKRTESGIFRVGYFAYRVLHFLLTGKHVMVGNFSVVPASYLPALTSSPDLWAHYAAGFFRSGLACDIIPIDRGRRLYGESKMNTVSLITHGLSAISVYGDVAGTRLLIFAFVSLAISVFALAVVVAIRMGTDAAIPGWATNITGFILVIMSQTMISTFGLAFTLINAKRMMETVPDRDGHQFISGVSDLSL